MKWGANPLALALSEQSLLGYLPCTSIMKQETQMTAWRHLQLSNLNGRKPDIVSIKFRDLGWPNFCGWGELLPFQVSGHPELYFPDLATGKAPCDLIYLCSFLSSLALALQLLSFNGSIGKTWHLEIEAHRSTTLRSPTFVQL